MAWSPGRQNMKTPSEDSQQTFNSLRLLQALLLLAAGLGFFPSSLWAQDCDNCVSGEIAGGETYQSILSMDSDCRHTGGAGPPYDIIRYEQLETGCVSFSASSICNTVLELLDEESCRAFILNNDCPSWEAEGLDNQQNSCLSLRLCPGIYYLCVYPRSPCEGWPETRDWEYSLRVSECLEEPEVPDNDSCEEAIELSMNSSVNGTTLHASCEDTPACLETARSGMAWYRFTGTGSEVELDTCSSSTEIQAGISIYRGGCGELSCLEAERLDCRRDRQTVIAQTEFGVPYYVAVYGSSRALTGSWMGEFELTINGTLPQNAIKPGDFNMDSSLDISDALSMLSFLFSGSARIPCPDQDGLFSEASIAVSDFNGDESVDISDAVTALSWLFLGGPPHHLGFECRPIEGCSGQKSCSSP